MQKTATIIVAALSIVALLSIASYIGLTLIRQAQGNLYIEKVETTFAWAGTPEGRGEIAVLEANLTIVNPTDHAYNLDFTIKLDELDTPCYSNYSISYINSALKQSVNISFNPKEPINIEAHQNKTTKIFFASLDSFRFSVHKIQVYATQNSFGDIINGQSFDIPQTMAYLKILSYSQVVSDYNTYHKYGNEYRIDNPNFLQRYINSSMKIGAANFYIAHRMNILGETYFNVTIANNSTFPVTHVMLIGDASQHPGEFGCGPVYNQVIGVNETLLFPVGQTTIPSNGYATGYIVNANSDKAK